MTILDDLPTGPELRPNRAQADKAIISAIASIRTPQHRSMKMGRHRPISARLVVAGCVRAGILTGGAATAAALLSTRQPTVLDLARCYSEPSANFASSFPGTSITTATAVGGSSTSRLDVPDQALQICASLWRQGFLVYGAAGIARPPAVPTTANDPVPTLVACVLPSGEAAVFPGAAGTCRSLNLPSMGSKSSASAR